MSDDPDPDCGGVLPDTSSPDNSSPDNPCDTVNEGEWAYKDTDNVKLKGDQVKFGGEYWGGAGIGVVGWGRVKWSVVCGFFTPELIGFIHLNGASGKYARMRISYYGSAGDHIATRYGGTVHAANDDHDSWEVDLLPLNQVQILKARVCTEISDDGDNFRQVDCQTVEFD